MILPRRTPRRMLFAVWIALLLLLALSATSAYTLGPPYAPIAGLVIAAGKASLVLLFFMHLRRAQATVALAAVVGFCWLVLLFALSFPDFLARY